MIRNQASARKQSKGGHRKAGVRNAQAVFSSSIDRFRLVLVAHGGTAWSALLQIYTQYPEQ
jgi:hypothetical protein